MCISQSNRGFLLSSVLRTEYHSLPLPHSADIDLDLRANFCWLITMRSILESHPRIVQGCPWPAWEGSKPLHGYHADDWHRAYQFLRWFWRKEKPGSRRTTNQGEGTSKDQGKNDATPVEYYNPFEKSDDQQGVTDDMLSAVLNSG